MSKDNISDVMVEVKKLHDLKTDLRNIMDLFVQIDQCPQFAVGIIVSEEDVKVILRRGDSQLVYAVDTPTECGAATEYDIHDAVSEIFRVAGIETGDGSRFTTGHTDIGSLTGEGPMEGEFDAAVCTDAQELREELDDILSYRVIDWS